MCKTIVAFGEILWDIMPEATVLGGAPFNFINRINSLGDRGVMISRLGRDALGEKAFGALVSFGLETAAIQWDDTLPTGTVQVGFDENGGPDFFIVPDVAYDKIALDDSLPTIVTAADCICFGTLVQRADRARKTLYALLDHAARSLKFLDINLRKHCFSPTTVEYSLHAADILKLNDDEIAAVAEMLSLKERGVEGHCRELCGRFSLACCLVTLGGKGVFVYAPEEGGAYIPGYRVDVVDTVGSGDAFSAGFIHRYIGGASIRDAAAFGNALGALTATKQGGTAPVAESDLMALIADSSWPRLADSAFERFLDR